eukprot:TRINITY_DN1052_c0_g1_i1.p1 TRINITY_DN1052_c0_g1~~TRINITY_DN1052_c0_g1_i1.p1  ORF type:complete len:826 (-),score=249.95 TRINITY_DN1052_c0_g1_i1:517-2994(-)
MSRLIVKNLPLSITEEKLRSTFSSKGNITDLQLKYNKDGKFRGFAFLGFKSEEEAESAMNYFHATYIGAAKINVQKCADLGENINNKKEFKKPKVDSEKETKSKKKAKKEATSILDKYKDDAKFQDFLRIHKRNAESWTNESIIEVATLYKEENKDKSEDDSGKNDKENQKGDDTDENSNKKKPKKEKDYFHVKLSNLPYKFKKKEVKLFLNPLKPPSIRMPPKNHGIAYVGFWTEKERNQALNKHKSLWEGHQIFVAKYEKKDGGSQPAGGGGGSGGKENAKWKEQEAGVADTETVGESGRIFVRNLSYTVTEDDLREMFEKFGPLTEVNLPIDKMTRRSKGFAFITFVMPEHAVQAFSQLDGSTYQGRLMHLIPGKSRDDDDENHEAEGSNYKKKKALKEKKEAGLSHNWNSLFLGGSAVADLMSEKYSVDKADVVLGDAGGGKSAAVRLALGETQIIQETKKYLEAEGVKLEAFDRPPQKRSKSVIIAKNLPAHTPSSEIRDLFARFGVLGRVLLPPGGITAVIEFAEPGEARAAFTNLAYTRFHSTPLYLEWAPEDTFSTPFNQESSSGPSEQPKPESKPEEDIPIDNDETPEANSTLFVKNLNFDTTDQGLADHFSKCGKIYSCNVATKKDGKTGSKLSMGFGFVTYMLKSCAEKALKELQHSRLDEHALELKRSNRALDNTETNTRKERKEGAPSCKILVRNVAFQATKQEITEIFKTYGELTAVRLPRKMSGTGSHRGFAFVDYATKADAKKAMAELSGSTHLYGRRLVLEWAEQEESLDELRKRTADQFNAGSKSAGKRTKFEMAASGKGGDEVDDD